MSLISLNFVKKNNGEGYNTQNYYFPAPGTHKTAFIENPKSIYFTVLRKTVLKSSALPCQTYKEFSHASD